MALRVVYNTFFVALCLNILHKEEFDEQTL